MDLNELRAQDEKLNTAQWVGDLPGLPGLELKVLPISSPLVRKAWGRKQRNAPKDEADREGFEEQVDLEVYAETILQDWRGLTQDGEPLNYSPELARQLITLGVFEQAVRIAAARVSSEREERQQELEGNS